MNAVVRRLRFWLRAQRTRGASWPRSLFVDAPRDAGRLVRSGAAAALNRARIRHRGPKYAAELRRAFAAAGDDPFVVVVVPGLLHLLVPAVRLARRHVPVVLVLNGLPAWEETLLRAALPDPAMVRLEPLPGSLLSHGAAVDCLLQLAPGDFALLDPDLFVFDAALFEETKLRAGEAAAGTHGYTHGATGLRFPRTHLLALDGALLRELAQRYGVGAETRRWVPKRLLAPLATLGLGAGTYPKEHLSHFDTLELLMAAALTEGRRLRVIDAPDAACHHVGGASYRARDAARDYLDLRLLELPVARPYAAPLRERWGATASTEQARERLVAAQGGAAPGRIDALIERLARALPA